MSKNSEIILTDSAVDFLKEEVGGGSSTVIANPTLVGDEPNLEGLEVNGVKYAVPQGGGSTYTAGNGITITEENVINADTKVVEYDGDLRMIPNDILESLNVGDVLNVSGNECYFVTSKNESLIVITSVGTGQIRGIYYQKVGEYYEYLDMGIVDLPDFAYPADLGGDEGYIESKTYDSIEYYGYCKTDYGMAVNIGFDEEKESIKLSTVVQDNKYYTVSFTWNEPESEEEEGDYSYAITEHAAGGAESNVITDVEIANAFPIISGRSYYVDVNAVKQLLTTLGIDMTAGYEDIFAVTSILNITVNNQVENAYALTFDNQPLVSVLESSVVDTTFNGVLTALANETSTPIGIPFNSVDGVYALSINVAETFYSITKAQFLSLFTYEDDK